MANLVDANDIQKSLKYIANTIRETDRQAAQRLDELGLAVGNGSNADAWAASDIYQIIEPDQIIARYKVQHRTDRIHSLLEWARNIFIFSPLVVTWFGVSQAVDKYNQYISNNPSQSIQPFLLLWQQGFGDTLPGPLKLSSLALVDFCLLITVLVLTFAVYFVSNTIKHQRERDAEDLRSQLTHALSGAALLLRTWNRQQPTNMVTRFEQVTQQFENTIAKLLNQIETLANRQQQELRTFVDFKNDLSNSLIAVASSTKDMKNSTTLLQQSVGSLLTPAQNLAARQGALLTSTQEAVTLLKNHVNAQGLIVKEQQKWGTELSNVLGGLKSAVDQGKMVAGDIQQFTNKQTGLVTAMERERNELAKLANNVLLATDSLKRAVTEIDRSSHELNGININMDQILRRIVSGRP